ncbi:MAG: hypothetical protein ACKOXU_12675 [Limnohabitans sp.]
MGVFFDALAAMVGMHSTEPTIATAITEIKRRDSAAATRGKAVKWVRITSFFWYSI